MLPRPPQFMPPLGPPKRSSQERVLAEWRGHDTRAAEKLLESKVRPVGGVMERVLQSLRIDRRQGEAEIVKVWNNLLSPDIIAHAQPTGLRKGTLFVKVDSSPWLDEIVRWRRKEILNRLQHSFGKELIVRISFSLG